MKPEVAAPAELQVVWPRELLDAPPEVAARAFARSLRGYARRLDPERAKRFAMHADTPLADAIDETILDSFGGIHPKHRLTEYHTFFVDRIAPGERAIDLGCGIGMVALSIVQRSNASVTGVDWSDHNLAIAATLAAQHNAADKLTFVKGDICTYRVPGTFDAIVLSNVIEHIADRPNRLREWVAWYVPKRILIRVPAFDRDWRVPLKKELGIDWRCDPTHETEYTMPQVEQEMHDAGLCIREVITRWCEYWVHAEPVTNTRPG